MRKSEMITCQFIVKVFTEVSEIILYRINTRYRIGA